MKQYEAVISTLEKMGGQATLGQLYLETLKIPECKWGTKTPFASIRRIVQVRPEIVKIRPGLYALKSYQERQEKIAKSSNENLEVQQKNHYYYQGIIVEIGNMRGFGTYIPNQDKNKPFISNTLGSVSSLKTIPKYSYDSLVKKSSTVDVIWFNDRKMPDSFFEVEHSTDFQNSLLKFSELSDFFSKMIIVSDQVRRKEYDQKVGLSAFKNIQNRVRFLPYNTLISQYENEIFRKSQEFII